jgi:hypothetical protein
MSLRDLPIDYDEILKDQLSFHSDKSGVVKDFSKREFMKIIFLFFVFTLIAIYSKASKDVGQKAERHLVEKYQGKVNYGL